MYVWLILFNSRKLDINYGNYGMKYFKNKYLKNYIYMQMKISFNIVYMNYVVCFRNYDEYYQLLVGKVLVLIYDDEFSFIIVYILG